jgi:FemAB family protein
LRSSTKGIEIGSNEGPLFPPLMSSGLSPRSKKKAYARSYELILGLSAKLRTDGWKGVETIFMQDGLSDWHMMQMDGGASLSVKHDLYLDLSLDLSEIKSRMRKSYRSLITSGERLWVTDVLRVPDRRVWQEFQSLHLNVAGRQTRSQKTWDLQLHSIALGNGFLVMLRDDQGRPVGGGFFQHTRDEALYSVGAYDRSLFDKPLGHLVQWTAIKELRQLGVRWYRIGERAYRSDDDFRHEKMITISHFKEGFSTHCFLRALTSNKSARVCAGDGVAAVND